ncbi:MAG: DUF4058 family protein [Anaerolineales bacterium]|nr:MAG: DUF4058 family protein [Anaerolineales bacterium]
MPSPFPGMDPYLEDPTLWPDVHQSLITYIRDALQPELRPRYHACIGERRYVVESPHPMYPAVVLVRRPRAVREAEVVAPVADVATVEADTPVVLAVSPVEHREPFVEIVHTAGGEVITVIEVLSPANKTPGEGHRLYRRKQKEILDSSAHLVEVDFLSEGLHTVAISEEALASLKERRYLVSVNRRPKRYQFELYPVPLQRRLPRIRVPLREPDPDVVLDLQAVFTRCYDNGGYEDLMDYHRPPPVSLSSEEVAWLESLLGKG